MTREVPLPGQDEADRAILHRIQEWIERAVIGLNLCPFARAPVRGSRVRLVVSHARDADSLLDDLCAELQSLAAADDDECETTLLIVAELFADFLDFNDFLDQADAAIEVLKLDGMIQVASFHPDYRFADSADDDVANCSNRAPFPVLHLLRESSVERAVEALADSEDIYRRNIETLQTLGWEGWNALWPERTGKR
ncbi:MAG: DUF1415 domain-containing protein [Dokdonella sp.]|nr:DUF1415 domain-containing protein [Dokdonella sp.]